MESKTETLCLRCKRSGCVEQLKVNTQTDAYPIELLPCLWVRKNQPIEGWEIGEKHANYRTARRDTAYITFPVLKCPLFVDMYPEETVAKTTLASGIISRIIQAIETASGYCLAEVYNLCAVHNVSRATYQDARDGRRIPTPKTLGRLSKMYGVNLAVMINAANEKKGEINDN